MTKKVQGTRFELLFNGKKPSVSPVGLISEKKYKNRFIKNPLDWLQIKE